MFAAKLFATLTVVFAVLAGLSRLLLFPGIDVYLRSTYFVLGPWLVLLFCLLTSANFAVLYYAGERIFHARWNHGLTLGHFCLFLCFAICLSIVFITPNLAVNSGGRPESFDWMIVALPLGLFSLVASLLVFGINLTLTVVQVLRARFASH